ncbi:cupin domain-containing protein [Devosia sp. RR2S18]|uniref:cupin domain-containing protein n=1 Tax=Devosia rhizosphaerae TaxID=3049774 RepID=UPI00254136F8|nr:cupin domain-containing protein [Devosia sp. RR2S18]WIJ26957.1 cupin domain-containing protein [Devosia sp. RR2S18]
MALKHANAAEVVDLLSASEQQPGKTAAVVKSEHFEAVRLVVKAGTEIPPHQVNGPITLQCLSGCAILGVEGRDLELRPGQWTYLEGGVRHWVKGVEDAVLLLTIIFRR